MLSRALHHYSVTAWCDTWRGSWWGAAHGRIVVHQMGCVEAPLQGPHWGEERLRHTTATTSVPHTRVHTGCMALQVLRARRATGHVG